MQVQGRDPPHVFYTVTQLAAITSLRGWSNLSVKVVGVLCNINIDEKAAALHEFGEPHQPVFIMVSRVFSFTVSSLVREAEGGP